MIDTRLINAASDVKAAAAALASAKPSPEAARAAIDDARCLLHELMTGGPKLPDDIHRDIDVDYRVLNNILDRWLTRCFDVRSLDAVYGSLTRIADRWTA